jgi:hypothetical protein
MKCHDGKFVDTWGTVVAIRKVLTEFDQAFN